MMNAKNLIEQLQINELSFHIWQNDYKMLKSLLATPLGQVGSIRIRLWDSQSDCRKTRNF